MFNKARQLLCGLALCVVAAPALALLPIQYWQAKSGARVYFVETRDLPDVPPLLQALIGQFLPAILAWLSSLVYRQVLARDPYNPGAFNNLAYYLGKDPARIDEALDLAERAYKAAPRSPAVADTLGWLLYKKGNALDRAETLLGQAVAGVPDEPEVRYHLGMVLAKQGKKEAARRELERALQSPAFPAADEARRVLETLR